MYTLLYLKWINNKGLLYNNGTVFNVCGSLDGWGLGAEWIRVLVWLSPFPVHLKLSQIVNKYTLIQNKKFFLKSLLILTEKVLVPSKSALKYLGGNWTCPLVFILLWFLRVFLVGLRLSPAVALRLSFPAAYGISVPQSGMEHSSPALESGFLTTGPPGIFAACYYKW